MIHTRLWVAATIIALAIVVGFLISVPHTRDIPAEKEASVATSTTPTVSLRDSYRKGMHTLTGSVSAPNPCTALTATATVVGTTTSQSILVALSLSDDSGICLQVITPLSFTTTVAAPAGLPINVTVNGKAATITTP
ncbi:MAG TPA: hypothetical protein VF803_02010 [Candidatus Paceibacterota bacterium]